MPVACALHIEDAPCHDLAAVERVLHTLSPLVLAVAPLAAISHSLAEVWVSSELPLPPRSGGLQWMRCCGRPVEVCWFKDVGVTLSALASGVPRVWVRPLAGGAGAEVPADEAGWEFGTCCHCRNQKDRS